MIKKDYKKVHLYILRKFKKNRHLFWVYYIQIKNIWKKESGWRHVHAERSTHSLACHFKIKGRGKKSFTPRDQLTVSHAVSQAQANHVQHSTAAQHRTLFKIKGKVPRGSRIVFDVQLLAWSLRSCSTDGVKNALLISHFIKFNPLFFEKNL